MMTTCGYILLVDDDPLFRAFVADLLGTAGYAVREVSSGPAGIATAAADPPIAALVDVNLPTINGYEVCRTLKEQHDIPVLLVSGYRTEPLDEAAGLLLGADDYLVKPTDPSELLGRVRRLAPHPGRRAGGPLPALTPREREVLQLLVDGLTSAQVAQKLVITPRTAETHIQRILGKLEVHSRAQAIAAAVRAGVLPAATVDA